MELRQLKPGDRIEACKLGRVFEATVLEKRAGEVFVQPPAGISYRHLSARQVRGKLS